MASGASGNGLTNRHFFNAYLAHECAKAIKYFRGPAATAILNHYFENNIELARHERALLILRLQYLDAFSMHYPICTYCDCFRRYNMYFQIGMNCYHLRRLILEVKVKEYIEITKRIVYLIDVMGYVMMEHQMVWFSCQRCIFYTRTVTCHGSPLIECLALKYNVSAFLLVDLLEVQIYTLHNPNMPIPNVPQQNEQI